MLTSFKKNEIMVTRLIRTLYPKQFKIGKRNERKYILWHNEDTNELFEIKIKEALEMPIENNKFTGNETKNKIIKTIKNKVNKCILYNGCLYFQFKNKCNIKLSFTAMNGWKLIEEGDNKNGN